jgi:hypothetical protein
MKPKPEYNAATAKILPLQTEQTRDLFLLKSRFPNLKVIPLVLNKAVPQGTEAVEFQLWVGSLGPAKLAQHIMGKEGIYFRDDYGNEDVDEMLDILTDVCGPIEAGSPDDIKEQFDALPWETVIAVDINMAD